MDIVALLKPKIAAQCTHDTKCIGEFVDLHLLHVLLYCGSL